MSARAKWLACLAAFAVGGLVASIPAFLDGPSSPVSKPARQPARWIGALSQRPTLLATAPGGERFVATRQPGTPDGVCFTLGSGGGGWCGPRSASYWDASLNEKDVALVGRTRDRRGVAWWGLVGDDVDTVRVRYANGVARRVAVRRGFVLFGAPVSVTALAIGTAMGKIDRTDWPTINCTPESCSSVIVFQSAG
jgi:hypothetical protein